MSGHKLPSMAKILSWLGWLLIAAGVAVIGGSYWIPSAFLEPLKSALPAGVLIALAGHLFTQARTVTESAEKRSQFHLDSCVEAYEQARNLLLNGNNERPAWIAAGRALAHANELAGGVSVEAHQRVLELHRLKYRSFFHEAIAPKPPAFFYGVGNTLLPIDEAAALSTKGEEKNGRVVTSTVKELSEKSLYAVWQAAQWPQEYRDPLARSFSQEERAGLLIAFQGLDEYLEHKERWASASGRLFARNRENGR